MASTLLENGSRRSSNAAFVRSPTAADESRSQQQQHDSTNTSWLVPVLHVQQQELYGACIAYARVCVYFTSDRDAKVHLTSVNVNLHQNDFGFAQYVDAVRTCICKLSMRAVCNACRAHVVQVCVQWPTSVPLIIPLSQIGRQLRFKSIYWTTRFVQLEKIPGRGMVTAIVDGQERNRLKTSFRCVPSTFCCEFRYAVYRLCTKYDGKDITGVLVDVPKYLYDVFSGLDLDVCLHIPWRNSLVANDCK